MSWKATRTLRACLVLILAVLPVMIATAQDAPVGRLRIGILGDESTLTPYTYVTGYPGWNLLLLQYDTLYQLDLDGISDELNCNGDCAA